MNEAERTFVRALITLSARIRHLRYDISDGDAKKLKAEVEECRAEMDRLNSYAEQHRLELNRFQKELDDIVDILLSVESEIETRQATSGESDNASIWQQIRSKVTWILNLLWSWVMNAGRVLMQRTIRLLAQTALAQLPPPSDDDDDDD